MYKRYKGDDLLSDDPRLKCDWEWSRSASLVSNEDLKTWTHFQESKAYVGSFRLSAIQWGVKPVYYEAMVSHGAQTVVSDGGNEKVGIKTRIDAQIKAEKMLIDWITTEYKHIHSILAGPTTTYFN